MSLNPYQPEWVCMNIYQEDSLYEGMQVRIEGGEPERVVAIRSYDVDMEDGYANVTPIGVKVEEDGEWWSLHEVQFLPHELALGRERYEVKILMARATRRITYRDGQMRSNGRPPLNPADYLNPAALVRVLQYDAQGKREKDLPF